MEGVSLCCNICNTTDFISITKKEKRKKRKQENGRKRKERKKHRALLTGQSFWDASCVVLTKSISVCIRWVTHDPYI